MNINYHISKSFLGENPVLKIKVPENSVEGIEDVKTKRVCFAPSIEKCLLGICGISEIDFRIFFIEFFENGTLSQENPGIYKTNSKLIKPINKIPDYNITKEVWSLSDIKVDFLGYLSLEDLIEGKIKVTENNISIIKKEYLDKLEIKFLKENYNFNIF